jgi:hypothetical protein
VADFIDPRDAHDSTPHSERIERTLEYQSTQAMRRIDSNSADPGISIEKPLAAKPNLAMRDNFDGTTKGADVTESNRVRQAEKATFWSLAIQN